MKKLMALCVVAVLCAFAMAVTVHAESGQKCASDCVNKCAPKGSGKDYQTCLDNCLGGCYDKPTGIPPVPEPTPVKPTKKSKNDLAPTPAMVASAGAPADRPVAAANPFDVNKSTTTASRKGGDGAACSTNEECRSNTCEGGSCCTAHGAPCDSSSHCCGYQSCTNGKCP